MRARSAVSVAVVIVVSGFWVGCGVEQGEDSQGWNLEGSWEVSPVRFDNVVQPSYMVSLEQEADSVAMWRDDETISTGEIRGDTLFCTDWDGYGVGRIFIDDWRHMHSETPANEQLDAILFDKHR